MDVEDIFCDFFPLPTVLWCSIGFGYVYWYCGMKKKRKTLHLCLFSLPQRMSDPDQAPLLPLPPPSTTFVYEELTTRPERTLGEREREGDWERCSAQLARPDRQAANWKKIHTQNRHTREPHVLSSSSQTKAAPPLPEKKKLVDILFFFFHFSFSFFFLSHRRRVLRTALPAR